MEMEEKFKNGYAKIHNYGDIKGKLCADGLPQRQTMKKEDTNLPTVATESVFITSTIDAFEG